MTSLMRFRVAASTPIEMDTKVESAGSKGAHFSKLLRKVCEGTPKITMAEPSSAAAASDVAIRPEGSSRPGK